MDEEETEEPVAVPNKLAIGVPGGFTEEGKREEFETRYSLAVMPEDILIPLPCTVLPEQVLDSITSVQVRN